MAVITVTASGLQLSSVTLDDTLQPGSDVSSSGVTYVEIDGVSTLRSLFIGSSIEVDIGYFNSGALSGTGNIFGANNPNATLPALVNYGILDINGTIAVTLTSYNQLVVSAGERLDLEGDFSGQSAATITVAPTGELDVNSQSGAQISVLATQGTLRVTAPNTTLSGATTLAGNVIVQGDALNGAGSGVAAPRAIGSAYVATLDLSQSVLTGPITNLTLLQDAKIRFSAGTTTVQRLVVAGSATALAPLDVLTIDGTVQVTGDGSSVINQVVVGQAEFAGAGTIDFAVAATSGGANLQQQLVVDAGVTVRNGGTMTIGSQGTAPTIFGAASAAAGSTFVNSAGAQLTVKAGATLSVATIQNAGSINVSSGTLAFEAAVQGAGTIAVESGATLSINAAFAQGGVALRSGSLLQLSQLSSFASTIQAPAVGAKIDLIGLTATSATVSNGSIVVTTTSGAINLAETGLINGTTLGLSSDSSGGTLLTVAAAATVPGTSAPTSPASQAHPAIYRFFDNVYGTQFLTASSSETQMLQATRPDLVYEGVGLTAVDPATDPAAAPVFRFFDSKFGTHFYTSSTSERDTVIATRPDLVSEGIGFYEHTAAQPGDVAVYRFFDSNAGTHFYTSNAGERATIIATRPDLVSEGIGFYAPPA